MRCAPGGVFTICVSNLTITRCTDSFTRDVFRFLLRQYVLFKVMHVCIILQVKTSEWVSVLESVCDIFQVFYFLQHNWNAVEVSDMQDLYFTEETPFFSKGCDKLIIFSVNKKCAINYACFSEHLTYRR